MGTKKERPPTAVQKRVLELARDGRIVKTEESSGTFRNGRMTSLTFRTVYVEVDGKTLGKKVSFLCVVRCQARGWVMHEGRDPTLKLTEDGLAALAGGAT
jgi:hypothetical protein